MTKTLLAAVSTGFLVLGGAAFAQTSTANPPQSQSTASGSGNSASVGTESNSDQPDLATKKAARRDRHPVPQTGTSSGTTETAGPTTTASGQMNGRSKFPGSGP